MKIKRFSRTLIVVSLYVMMSLSANVLSAQGVKTNSITFGKSQGSSMFMPPDLRMNVGFKDENGNNILEAEEQGIIILDINNKGGKAGNVRISISTLSPAKGIIIQKAQNEIRINASETKTVEIPVKSDINLETGQVKFKIVVSEPNGYDINAILEVPSFAYQKARMTINGVEISDSGKDLRAYNGNPDNKLQNQDVALATVLVQNIGDGQANGVSYVLESRDPNMLLLTNSGYSTRIEGKIGDLLVGQTHEIKFRISPNARYRHKGEYVPVYLTITEEKGFGDIKSQQIPLPFDEAAVPPEVVKINGNKDKLMASLGARVYSDDARVTSDHRIRDISVVPVGQALYKNAVAVVIGIEEFQDTSIPQAPYAQRDADVMSEYFKKAMGVNEIILMTNERVKSMDLKKTFDPVKGLLKNAIVAGKTDVFVYYSGHGVPVMAEDGRSDIVLIPYDVPKDWIREEGYSLNRLYDNLASLGAKSVTVILDACFSGGSRSSKAFGSKSISNQKMVIDGYDMSQPWKDNPDKFRVFASSRGDQSSLGYDNSMSGLFTYYLALGLQGDADMDGNGSVTMKELVDFVSSEVNNQSGGTQTPQFFGNSDDVIVKLK